MGKRSRNSHDREKRNKYLILIDIDGTLADVRERMAKAGPRPARANRKVYEAWVEKLQQPRQMLKDKPIVAGFAAMLGFLQLEHCVVVYLTGRASKYRNVTLKWLAKLGAPTLALLMRNNTDWRSARAYKEESIHYLLSVFKGYEVIALDDDGDGDCSKMYKKNGWAHVKVIV